MAGDDSEDQELEQADDQDAEDGIDDGLDSSLIEPAIDTEILPSELRIDFVEKVFITLSADAQRAGGELQRADVNRIYLRRQLSIAECVAVEEKLAFAKIKVIEEDDEVEDEKSEDQSNSNKNKKYRYLTETEERDLGRKIQIARNLPEDTSRLDKNYVDRVRKDAERAKALFVTTNVRYVELVARRWGQRQHMSLDDIMQEGFIGLLRATDLYDPELGFRFKTYATWWIDQRIGRAIADQERTVRLPVHLNEKLHRIRRSKEKLRLINGRAPTLDTLADAIGMSSERLMKLLWRVETTDCIEGDSPAGDKDTLLSNVVDASEPIFEYLVHKQLHDRFEELLSALTPREARILRMRFGIDLDSDYTLESVGQLYGVTRERIRQIEAKALNKLRHPDRSGLLRDFLDP